jgi:hypothetical protein
LHENLDNNNYYNKKIISVHHSTAKLEIFIVTKAADVGAFYFTGNGMEST